MLYPTILAAALVTTQDSAPVTPGPIDLHVEYVAGADVERAADFKRFLATHFTEVEVTKAADLRSGKVALDALSDGDVIIIDTNLVGVLPAGFDRPLVAIGGGGVHTMESIGAKADWL